VSDTAESSRRQAILNAVVEEEARLRQLKTEEGNIRARLALLQAELASLGTEAPSATESPSRTDRQEHLDQGRDRFHGDLPARWIARSRRTIAIGERRARMVLLLCGSLRGCGAKDGLPFPHPDHVAAPPTQDGLVRSAFPQPGHNASRRFRQSNRIAVANNLPTHSALPLKVERPSDGAQ